MSIKFILISQIFLMQSLYASMNACSFYNNPKINSNFWSCAEPKVEKRTCTKIKGVCPACVKYKGDKGSMYMPDFFVEVTSRFGKSHFDGFATLKAHLKKAVSHYGHINGFDWLNDGASEGSEDHSSFWHVRILQPPFGTTAFSYIDMPFYGVSTSVAPTCFQGISEFLKDQWNFNLADAPFAAAWAPIGLKVCNSDLSAVSPGDIANAVSNGKTSAGESLGGSGIPSLPVVNCAFPMSGKTMMAMNMKPTSDALSFTKLCMRGFGNLIPREGTQDTEDTFLSAIKAAWKFLSLVKDMHPHTGVTNEDDHKWQLVYPPLENFSARCFRPGGLEGHLPTLGPLEEVKMKSSSYIFAIWRKRKTNSCYEPETAGVLWKQRIKNIDYNAFKAACEVL